MEKVKEYISIKKLADLLCIDEETILNFVNKYFPQSLINQMNGKVLHKTQLNEILDLFFQGKESKKWEISKFLNSNTSKWAVQLIAMYKSTFAYPASMSPAQGEIIRSLVFNTQPKHILEIGCWIGISTIWMASALQEINNNGKITSVDLFGEKLPSKKWIYSYLEDSYSYTKENISKSGLSEFVNIIQGNSLSIGKKYDDLISEPIDILLIDGDHSIDGCYLDFKLFLPYVKNGGYIILHDIYPEYCGYDGPRWLIDNIINTDNNSYNFIEYITHSINFGIAIIRVINKPKLKNLSFRFYITAMLKRIKASIPNSIKRPIKKLIYR